jgi:putative transport protein
VLAEQDVLVLAGYPEAIGKLKSQPKREAIADREHLDYMMVYVSKPSGGMRLPTPHPRSRDGDCQVAVATPTSCRARICWNMAISSVDHRPGSRRAINFGDPSGEASFGLWPSAWVSRLGAVGLVPIPIPGIGTVTLGLAGGPLVVSLVLGWLGRTGPVIWHLPASANQVLRNFGLALFLARVGIDSGTPFVEQMSHSGLAFVFAGMFVLLTVVLVVLLVGYFVLKMNFDDLLGIASGANRKPGDPRLWQFAGPDGQAGHELRHDLPGRRYDREDHRRADPGRDIRDRGALAVVVHGCGLQCSARRTTSARCSMS